MYSLKQLITEDDNWTGAEGIDDGTPFILRFRPHLQEFIASKQYDKLLTIIWHYNSDNISLMPSDDDMELMEAVEDALVAILESDAQAVLAFVYTGQNQKEWNWYSTDIEETGRRLNEALSEFDRLPLELSAEDDVDWSEYNAVLDGVDYSEYDGTSNG